MKLGTVHVGLAGHDDAVIHSSVEISAYQHDKGCTLLSAIAGEAPTTEEPCLEILEGAVMGQVAAALGIEAEHLLPESRDEHLAVTEAPSVPHCSQCAIHEASNLKIGMARSQFDASDLIVMLYESPLDCPKLLVSQNWSGLPC
jgi:hypothetical protein